jgi:hypothetical protein
MANTKNRTVHFKASWIDRKTACTLASPWPSSGRSGRRFPTTSDRSKVTCAFCLKELDKMDKALAAIRPDEGWKE